MCPHDCAVIHRSLQSLLKSNSAAVAVETASMESETAILQSKMYIRTPLDDFLLAALQSELPASLIVLCGNAGDGKSMLIREMRNRLPHLRINWDATHAKTQVGTVTDAVDRFLDPFSDDATGTPPNPSVIAINTGILVGFFESETARKYKWLRSNIYDALEMPAGIIESSPQRDLRVIVVDLDRRDPLNKEGALLDHMLDRFNIESAGDDLSVLPQLRGDECSCIVRTNLALFARSKFRESLRFILNRVQLNGTHFTMRSLWDLLARIALGGKTDWKGEACPFSQGESDWHWRAEQTIFASTDPAFEIFRNEDPAAETSRDLDRMSWQISRRPSELTELEDKCYPKSSTPAMLLPIDSRLVLDDSMLDVEDNRKELFDHIAMRKRALFFACDEQQRDSVFRSIRWEASTKFTEWLSAFSGTEELAEPQLNKTFREFRLKLLVGIQQLFLREEHFALVPEIDARRRFQLYVRIEELDPRIQVLKARTMDLRQVHRFLPALTSSIPISLHMGDSATRFLSLSVSLPIFETLDRAGRKYRLGIADIRTFSRFQSLGERLATLPSKISAVIATDGATTVRARRTPLGPTVEVA